MDLEQKLAILGEAARYDASCASCGSERQAPKGKGVGNAYKAGICHSWTEDGRCVSLLKVLMSNACQYNCAYCANRCSANTERATMTPREIAHLTAEFFRRNYIEGLFISSGVVKNAVEDRPVTIDRLLNTARLSIAPHCLDTKRALASLRWDENDPRRPEDKNLGNINDIYDAFCYTWITHSSFIDRRGMTY